MNERKSGGTLKALKYLFVLESSFPFRKKDSSIMGRGNLARGLPFSPRIISSKRRPFARVMRG